MSRDYSGKNGVGLYPPGLWGMYLPSFKAEKKSLELRGGGQALIYEATSYRDTRGMQWVVGQDMVAVLAPRGGGRF